MCLGINRIRRSSESDGSYLGNPGLQRGNIFASQLAEVAEDGGMTCDELVMIDADPALRRR